jgi:hypothetical protein
MWIGAFTEPSPEEARESALFFFLRRYVLLSVLLGSGSLPQQAMAPSFSWPIGFRMRKQRGHIVPVVNYD